MKYSTQNHMSYRDAGKDGVELMANFTAIITSEIRYVDGANSQTMLTLEGTMPPEEEGQEEPTKLPPVTLTAEEFLSMNWIVRKWGTRCVVMPGGSIKDDLRTMIQMNSRAEVQTVYKQTGWQTIRGKPHYLHQGGAIGAAGNDPSVTVQLPPELSRYDLCCDLEPADCLAASLALTDLCRPDITWPLLAGTLAPLYGPCDFGLHVTGRTGSFKSEMMSLFQSHYGSGMDARHLPGSWSSSANALEALAYYAANAVFCVDDFVPQGSTYQQKQYQSNADRIIRAQGNQAGRARLSDAASLQQTMYPRGVILSTGEDTPEGHSVRARLLIAELAAGEIEADDLTRCQQQRAFYPGTVAWLAQSLAKRPADLRGRTEDLRSTLRTIGHSRTPGILGRLIATVEDALSRAAEDGLLPKQQANSYTQAARNAILDSGRKQQAFLEDADPTDLFCAAVRQVIGSGGGHFRSLNGGVPRNPEVLGWSIEKVRDEMDYYKSRGPCIGWVHWNKDELLVDVVTGWNIIRKAAGHDLSLSKQTLFKRLKDAGLLTRVDDARNRNTVRITAEQHPRQVLCLSLLATLDLKEVPNGKAEEKDDGPDDDGDGSPTDDEGPGGSEE